MNLKLKTSIIKCEFPRGIHIGENKLWDAEMSISADTIFSAMCHEAKKLKSDGIEEIVRLVENDNLLITDAMPFFQDELFLPKPFLTIRGEENDSSLKKLFKRINYIPLSHWNKYIKGSSNPKEIIEILEMIDHSSIFTKINHDIEGNHDLYRVGVRYFPENSGLYFIIRYLENIEDMLDDLVYSLSYSGIGGKRRIGVGQFEFTVEELPNTFENLINGDYKTWMNMSIGLPDRDELDVIDSSLGYQLVKRSGFVTSERIGGQSLLPARKKDIFMLKSGSIFTKKFKGKLFDVSDGFEHPVYRYGKPIYIGVEAND
ncbi:MAG: type III-A CRISPR-associated RAMP protein Csm4 [Tissierellia bacterium]|nr:type III-A CRISPR-associated RAMP protein Csm4 [Tissierellia bacterium]